MDFSDTSSQNMRIEVLPDGRIKIVIQENGKGIEAEMTPRQGADMMADLMKAGVVAWMRNPKNNLKAGGKLPLQDQNDIYTTVAWRGALLAARGREAWSGDRDRGSIR